MVRINHCYGPNQLVTWSKSAIDIVHVKQPGTLSSTVVCRHGQCQITILNFSLVTHPVDNFSLKYSTSPNKTSEAILPFMQIKIRMVFWGYIHWTIYPPGNKILAICSFQTLHRTGSKIL